MTALDSIKADEGCRLRAYQDHLGIWTIGWGTNLQVLTISQEQADRWLENALQSLTMALGSTISGWAGLPPRVQDVCLNMAYNMGVKGLCNFKHFLAACRVKDWTTAAKELEDSKWATQVPNRAKRLISIIKEQQ